ncbi:MAG: UDP-3-O-(3-hydroxymyristoyl)glucosamine N-acyltransferase [Coleofasciculaceae cyanobacterium SM2_1_6]|nr:UDP-3-O-(3-hydroxymyristoyl)glucosamine N-acyltransferase [Coleofasciculaceae cyanobacterium SM2_1_6]
MQFQEIIHKLESGVEANSLAVGLGSSLEITAVAAVDRATPGSLSYIEGGKFASMVQTTQASALILPLDATLQEQATARKIAWISSPEPRLAFALAIALFYQPYQPRPQIHPTAVIDPSVSLGKEVYVGAYSVLQAGVKLGDGVCVHPHVVVYPDAQIGDRTVLHSHCTIHERSQIGADCVIHSGAVIGAEGFGFVPVPTGWVKMQQSGYTVLEDGVEVGCNTAIDRPAVGETRIGKNTKLDNLVQIGHGCHVGANCAIASQAGLAGGVRVGNRVILAGQVGVANQAVIGDGAIATAKAGIHSDVEPGAIVTGIPALPHKLFLKVAAIQRKLPEIYQSFKQIQKQLKM